MTVRFFICLAAAAAFAIAGTDMRELRSIGGDSVAEFFYQAMGLFSYGMAALSVAAGIPVLAQEAKGAATPPTTVQAPQA